MTIAIVIDTLNPGGAERALTNLANEWVRRGHDIAVLTLYGSAEEPFYRLDPRIRLVPLKCATDTGGPFKGVLRDVRAVLALRKQLRTLSADVVVGFMEAASVISYLAARSARSATVVTERSAPQAPAGSFHWRVIAERAFRRADAFVVLTEEAARFHRGRGCTNVITIPNPALPVETTGETDFAVAKPAILAMGRLVQVKGYDLLLRAFALTRQRFPEWSLYILGEGPLRGELESLIVELGISECAYLPGLIARTGPLLAAGDIFVMSSISEGFPNALCEAMAAGLPAISTNCAPGPAEIIRDGVDGILVPPGNAEALADGMCRLMGDDVMRRQMAENAPAVVDRFSIERIASQWLDMFAEIASSKTGGR